MIAGNIIKEVSQRVPGENLVGFIRLLNEKVRSIAMEFPWRHYESLSSIQILAGVSTGTAVVENGAATVSFSDTLPEIVEAGWRFMTNGRMYDVDEVSGEKEIVITPEYEGADNDEATYSLWKDTYSLPEKFVSYNKAVRSDTGEPLVEVPLVEYINASMAIGSTSYGKRMFPCIDDGKKFCFYGVDSVTGAPSFRLVAQPQSDFMVNFYYRRFPVDATGPASVIDAPSYLEDAIIRGMVVEFLKRSTTEKGVSPLLQVEASGFKEAVATARRIETSLTQAVVQGSWQL